LSHVLLSRMPGKFENVSARQDFILRKLQETGEVSIEELCSSLEASTATIRRDLDDLEQRSLLRRTRGGAISISSLFYEPFKHDLSFQDKVETFAAEKRQIAQAAAALVHPGDTIALSGGTTTTEVVRYLKLLRGITIVTNAVNVAMELSSHKTSTSWSRVGICEATGLRSWGRWQTRPRECCFPTSCSSALTASTLNRGSRVFTRRRRIFFVS
jgi:DeoR/GlpR family transcriptional regulator of sugar metabolism